MKLADMDSLSAVQEEARVELHSILSYWMQFAVDKENGGFYGAVNNFNVPDLLAPKGLVLQSRILWAFSAAYGKFGNEEYREIAERAFQFIRKAFVDKIYGGLYWSVNAKGEMLDGKKQIYGLAFAIYGLAEYYKISGNSVALNFAIDLFYHIERYSFDTRHNGYIEAFDRDWSEIQDLRLGEMDMNDRKTMNTHVHIIEAYANLYAVWTDVKLKEKIENLLYLFETHFIDHRTYHLQLFFNDQWESQSTLQSYGHDIEAAWLLLHCAEAIQHPQWIQRFQTIAVLMTNAACEGLDADGGLWFEFEPRVNALVKEKHSWPQAEAIIGFANAYEITKNEAYLEKLEHTWNFIKRYIRDGEYGEWFWGVYDNYQPMEKDKAGFWKCPYHNGRSMLEIINRIESIKVI